MFHILKQRSTHAGKLERWLGRDECERISLGMRDWYGPDIAVAATPGIVYARKGGDFVGNIDGGGFSNLVDTARTLSRALARRQSRCFNAGFADLADLQSEATKGGKLRTFYFEKTGPNLGRTIDLWGASTYPAAGASGGAAPGGTAWTDASTGAHPFNNPDSGDTQHFVGGEVRAASGTTAFRCHLLYDRLFSVAKTMNSTATEAVTGVPTRYQSTVSTDEDYAGGNFLFPTALTNLPATAHSWTVCTYLDQGGNASTLPSVAGVSSAAANGLDLAAPLWFMPLEAGDTGVQALTQMQCNAAVASGTIDFSIGHPIAWLPQVGRSIQNVVNGINSAFQVTRVLDDAALALLALQIDADGTGNIGFFQTVSG